MIEERDAVAAHIALVMGAELGFSPDDCGNTMKAVLEWPESDLDRLWILKLEGFGWKVANLRNKREADDFEPDGYLIDGRSVVSHRNIGEWIRTCQEGTPGQVSASEVSNLLH